MTIRGSNFVITPFEAIRKGCVFRKDNMWWQKSEDGNTANIHGHGMTYIFNHNELVIANYDSVIIFSRHLIVDEIN